MWEGNIKINTELKFGVRTVVMRLQKRNQLQNLVKVLMNLRVSYDVMNTMSRYATSRLSTSCKLVLDRGVLKNIRWPPKIKSTGHGFTKTCFKISKE
jgi:hypothetical protein